MRVIQVIANNPYVRVDVDMDADVDVDAGMDADVDADVLCAKEQTTWSCSRA